MNKKISITIFATIVAVLTLYSGTSRKKKIPFNYWPVCEFKNIKVLIASHPYLSTQGFAGADSKEMENCIMIFPNIKGNTVFTNKDQGYGEVKRDIKIYFLDENFRILKSEIIKKGKGIAVAPEGSFMAIEGLP